MTRAGLLKRLALVTGVVYAALTYVVLTELRPVLGDVPPLDFRFYGYRDLDPATPFPLARPGYGRVYTDVYHVLDYVFIACLTGLICFCADSLRPARLWWLVCLFAAGYCAADLAENIGVRRLLGGEGSAVLVVRLSAVTQIKFACLALALGFLIWVWSGERTRK
ncbi:MAG: hypothetical protein AAGA12_08705 [Pseudomonadota bacterium]